MEATTPDTRITPETLAHLRTWEGRSEVADDDVTLAAAQGMAATLDHSGIPARGDELPPLWHWTLFTPRAPQSEVALDGHARRGGFLPPVALPRRMWAGGRLEWFAPLHVGDTVQRKSTIASVTHKAGRSGDLVFVVVRHELSTATGLAMTEEHDIVYRPAAQPGEAAPAPQPAPQGEVWSRKVVPDPVLLFRYSALTFNGHRIHYDRDYVTKVEGYPGLIVHGPLIATLLADLARREGGAGRFRRFSFRAVRPTFDLHPFHLCGKPSADGKSAQLWGRDHEGALTMQADVQFE